ncbi:uncharacterized protein LOC128550979 [Mercenaria mercenaria]|uniref:uncharacterized protein LOC128550979 n=1 Tax=Mercenaria mercenaria TaxID=6596 RepID=UPI00234FA601|nr:uncharacterized protein LOC128550979 [Mercenaria mercenaria]
MSAASVVTQNNVSVTFTVTFSNKCRSGSGRFVFLRGLSVVQCIQQCGLREQCGSLTYKRRMTVCELFVSAAGDMLTEDGNCIYIQASDIAFTENPCGGCESSKVCDMKNEACIFKECQPPVHPDNGIILGNMYSIGSMIRYACNHGYHESNGNVTAVCLDTAQWSSSVECAQDAQDTLEVTDCYVGDSWNYAGQKNVTATGNRCQRWDAQFLHPHTFIDVNYFPESDLSEAENYCRNPDRWSGGLWCFTADLLTPIWEECDILEC